MRDDEEMCNFAKFMVVPTIEEERRCLEAFYDATSNDALQFKTCAVCTREKLGSDGEHTTILSDQSVVDVLSGGVAKERVRLGTGIPAGFLVSLLYLVNSHEFFADFEPLII